VIPADVYADVGEQLAVSGVAGPDSGGDLAGPGDVAAEEAGAAHAAKRPAQPALRRRVRRDCEILWMPPLLHYDARMADPPLAASPALIPPEMLAHYNHRLESKRLTGGPLGALEFERIQSVLRRDLPPGPARFLDIGGGAGVHALPLARRGYEVHLLDPVELHVGQARKASAAQPGHALAAIQVGDARDLPHPTATFDAALMFGPLYHLTDRNDRLTALREARRVLRPNGVLFAVAISRYASFFDAFASAHVEDPTFVEIMLRDLADGQRRAESSPVPCRSASFPLWMWVL
jgi:SAM-dependent methyltransferase